LIGRALALGFCALVLLSGCGLDQLSSRPAVRQTVDIGLVGTFSGGGGFAGDYQKHSLQVRADALNASGGLLGRRVEVVAADDEGDAAKSRSLVHQLATDPDVGLVVGPSTTAGLEAVKGELAQARVPNCVPAQVSDDAMQGASASFRTEASVTGTVQTLLQALRQRRPDARKVALLAAESPDGHFYDARLGEQVRGAGLEYAGASFVADANADQQAPVQDLVNRGVQALVLSGDPAVAGRTAQLIGQLGQAGKVQLLGPPALASSQYPDAGGAGAAGTIFASAIQAYQTDEAEGRWPATYRNFVRSITTQYGYAAGGSEMQGSATVADCAVDWSAAVRKAGSLNGAGVINAWQTLDLPAGSTVLATHERFTTADHDALDPNALFVYQWQTGGGQRRLQQLAGP
jgi:branched-chain amino acid transport system substrate-binding protein